MAEEKEIKVGLVYKVKFGGGRVSAEITKSLPQGRFEAVILPSGTRIKVSAENIEGEGMTQKEWAKQRTPKDNGVVTEEDEQYIKEAKTMAKKTKTVKNSKKKGRKTSGLHAAARVLQEIGKPMRCPDIVKTALEKGYWSTKGKTPAATVYSAILREIASKGNKSRFRKSGRGEFELTAVGKDTK
jgi:hypothetical protein